MDVFVSLLNIYSLMGLIGMGVFLYAYKYSVQIFDWIERQTLGTRTYILEKLEFLSEYKAGKDFNRRNIFNISRIKILT